MLAVEEFELLNSFITSLPHHFLISSRTDRYNCSTYLLHECMLPLILQISIHYECIYSE
jgi:hypothetical protein